MPCRHCQSAHRQRHGNRAPHENIVPLAKEIVEAIGQNKANGTIHMVATTTLLRSRKAGRAQAQTRPHENNAKCKANQASLTKQLDIVIVWMWWQS